MIPNENKNWFLNLSKALNEPDALVEHELVPQSVRADIQNAALHFDIRVPNIFIEKIKDGQNALAKQFVPSQEELIFLPEQLDDPIGDDVCSPVKGLTHRYPDRVLLKPTFLCASYCRFCFRKNKVSDAQNNLTLTQLDECFSYIRAHPEIWEVILTGGDPLTLNDTFIEKILNEISVIDHVKIVRFHTRIPSVLPSRITSNLINLFSKFNKTIWMAVHINSKHEFTPECIGALNKLNRSGIPLLLQSVLLKGVNDCVSDLTELFKTAVEHKLKPYYLHYPDLACGTAHFRMPLSQALEIYQKLRGKISGLCIPPLIVDIPGGKGKVTVDKVRSWQDTNGKWVIESPIDGSHTILD